MLFRSLFEQGGDPKGCWCAWYRVANRDWTNSTPPQNRALLEELAAGVQAPDLVAYRGDKVVGWVSLGPREDFERLAHSRILAPVDDRPVWSIVCFVVGKRERGQGIAGALLAAAIDHARANGATTVEAYPVERDSPSYRFMGQRSTFLAAGFEETGMAGSRRHVMRLRLG